MTDGPPLPPSSPLVPFKLLHSKFHLCSVPTRALLLSAYIKFINLFPEVKATIQEVLRSDSQLRNADVELQQRAVEYLRLSTIASTDILVGTGRHTGGYWDILGDILVEYLRLSTIASNDILVGTGRPTGGHTGRPTGGYWDILVEHQRLSTIASTDILLGTGGHTGRHTGGYWGTYWWVLGDILGDVLVGNQ